MVAVTNRIGDIYAFYIHNIFCTIAQTHSQSISAGTLSNCMCINFLNFWESMLAMERQRKCQKRIRVLSLWNVTYTLQSFTAEPHNFHSTLGVGWDGPENANFKSNIYVRLLATRMKWGIFFLPFRSFVIYNNILLRPILIFQN